MNKDTLALISELLPLITAGLFPLARNIVSLVHKDEPTIDDWNVMLSIAESGINDSLAKLKQEGITPNATA